MQLSPKEIANILYKNCTTFIINTIDDGGFPYTEIIDSPLYRDKNMNFYFYTKSDSQTLKNLSLSTISSFTFYNPDIYKKVLLKGHLKSIYHSQIELSNGEIVSSQVDYQIVHFSSIEGLLYSDYKTHFFHY